MDEHGSGAAAPGLGSIGFSAEQEIAGLFAAELEIASVDPDDNFFDLGGDSLMAENLVLAIQKRFGMPLQTSILLEAQTPRALARVVATAGQDNAPSRALIVPVAGSTGSEPLAMIHGVSGSSLFANRFGRRLKERFSLLAVRGLGLEPAEQPYFTLDAMTAGYFDGLRVATGRPPRIIGGICMGGILAMEVGRRTYEATGERPQLLLIDPPPLGSSWLKPSADNVMTPARRRQLERHVAFWRFMRALLETVGLGRTPWGATARRKLFKKTLTRALAGVSPPAYPCDMLVVASSEWGSATVSGYRSWISDGCRVETVVLSGSHGSFSDVNSDAVDAAILNFLDSPKSAGLIAAE